MITVLFSAQQETRKQKHGFVVFILVSVGQFYVFKRFFLSGKGFIGLFFKAWV